KPTSTDETPSTECTWLTPTGAAADSSTTPTTSHSPPTTSTTRRPLMSDATLDPEFLEWARPQLRGRLLGPTRMVMILLLLKNLWEKDPAIRDNYRAMKSRLA